MKIFLTGASSGIGAATAAHLVALGHEVWGTSRDPGRIPPIAGLHAVRMDLEDRGAVREAWSKAVAEAGSIDVLINNAGSGHFGPAELLDAETLERQFRTLVFAHVALTQLALATMRAQDRGLIINVTSLASQLPVPFMAAYNAAKAAMASFTLSMQLELCHSRVRIVDLQPADIRTAFNASLPRQDSADPRYEAALRKVWKIVDRNMTDAPPPQIVAERIAALLQTDRPAPRAIVGGFFQAKVAPLIDRFLPQRVRIWGLKQYYRL